MTDMLSLPDDLLGLIVLETLRGTSFKRPDKYWCRIAGTCRRLWKLHLSPISHPISICHERGYPLEVDGIQWYLRRLRSAKSLAIGVGGRGWDKDEFAHFMQSDFAEVFNSIQAFQVLGVHFRDPDQEMYFRPRSVALVQGAPNLTALTLHLCTMQSIDLLSSTSLKYLALHISLARAWPKRFPDLIACPMLENLKVVMEAADGSLCDFVSGYQPDICLGHMPKLRHFELEEQAFPRDKLALPEGCQLFTKLWGYTTEFSGEECLESLSHHATIMCLRFYFIRAWPAALGHLRLQLLVLDYESGIMEDIPLLYMAVLQHIPHVKLYSQSFLDIVLTGGSWQSLDVFSEKGLCVGFSDMDAFVTSTKLFSFCYAYMDHHDAATKRKCAAMVDNMQATCGKHDVECYQTSHSLNLLGVIQKVTRISNRKPKPPLDTQEALEALEFSFRQLGEQDMLAPYEDFWPRDPCKSLSGMHRPW